ncbi:MAG: hypothetical protein ACHQC8_02380 [Solirubrobacterales bacterium]
MRIRTCLYDRRHGYRGFPPHPIAMDFALRDNPRGGGKAGRLLGGMCLVCGSSTNEITISPQSESPP